MKENHQYSLREVQESDLSQILEWRNSERIRNFSYNNSVIDPADHRRWFENLKQVSNRKVLVFECDHRPAGVVQFFDFDFEKRECKWGFYLGLENLPRGAGSEMGRLALTYAFDRLGIDRIAGEAISHNSKSIHFHKKMGFSQEGILEHQVFRDEKWLDIVLFSITRQQWLKSSQNPYGKKEARA